VWPFLAGGAAVAGGGVVGGTLGFGFETGFFLGRCEIMAVRLYESGLLTVRRSCSGVNGFGGRSPERVCRGGVEGRPAMLLYFSLCSRTRVIQWNA
jgi:hypothetical protein